MDNDKSRPNRKSIRLKGYDYSQAGAYFITICCQHMKCLFGKIVTDEMMLNEYGTIAYNEWNKLQDRFSNFELDVFQIMPNHMHGIIVLNEFVGATLAVARAGASPAPTVNSTIGDIVGAYKSLVANNCLQIFTEKSVGITPTPRMGKLWQRNYHDHIICNEQSYQTISNYITSNPLLWKDDKFFIP